MDNFFSQFRKEAQKIRLSHKERGVMRRTFEEAMRSGAFVKSPIRITPSPYPFFSSKLVSPLAFILLLAIAGGGTAYAAEGAVPGDTLYAIKLKVNEPVREALAVSSEAKANWHAEAAERRMEEAEVLAERGTLTPETKTELEANLDRHAAEVETVVSVIEQESPIVAADISTRFGSALAAHGAVIARLGEEGENEVSRHESGDFSRALKDRGRKIAFAERRVSLDDEAENTVQMAAKLEVAMPAPVAVSGDREELTLRLAKNASTTLDEAEVRLDSIRKNLGVTTTARVKAQIGKTRNLIRNLRGEGASASSSKDKGEKALKDAATLKVFIEAQEKFRERVLLPAPGIDDTSENQGDEEENEEDENEKEED